MKGIVIGFISAILLLQTPSIYAENILKAFRVSHRPIIDGKGEDHVWAMGEEIVTHDVVAGLDIRLRAVYTENELFVLVRFPDPDESRLHKPWIWNKQNNIYEMGPQREDCFVIKWALEKMVSDLSIRSDAPHKADVWFWKAHRTDPTGFADDKVQVLSPTEILNSMKVYSRSGKQMFLKRDGDEGYSAYKARIQIEYSKDLILQFIHRKPSGSRADVRARGTWVEGQWCIEFARFLTTGNSDDVQFDIDQTYLVGVSRYEIAGREPDHDLGQPLFGSGDISEKLTLLFKR